MLLTVRLRKNSYILIFLRRNRTLYTIITTLPSQSNNTWRGRRSLATMTILPTMPYYWLHMRAQFLNLCSSVCRVPCRYLRGIEPFSASRRRRRQWRRGRRLRRCSTAREPSCSSSSLVSSSPCLLLSFPRASLFSFLPSPPSPLRSPPITTTPSPISDPGFRISGFFRRHKFFFVFSYYDSLTRLVRLGFGLVLYIG